MATDFWASSHFKRWIVDRATLRQARSDDELYVGSPDNLGFLNIFFANLISKLGKKLQLRQRVIATATVFFRRFYVKNSYCETDPFIVIAACCYVAAKAEESPVHIKTVVAEARMLFSTDEYGVKGFPSDNSKLAEMEFYLVDELECDLIVFHPYRTLVTLCGKEGSTTLPEAEAGEADVDDVDGPRFWGTGEGKLELQEGAFQMAWSVPSPRSPCTPPRAHPPPRRFIINDTYRSELCLLHPPHIIAVAAIYLVLVFHIPTRTAIQAAASSHAAHASGGGPATATTRHHRLHGGLNVNMSLVATVAQEIIALYALWDRYSEDPSAHASARAAMLQRNPGSVTRRSSGTRQRAAGVNAAAAVAEGAHSDLVTPLFLVQLLLEMREKRMEDLAHPANGRPVVVNKMLERTQAAG
ncbi:cyclin-like protein [Epithele typhae]|uniref:cyclin-like protein n=1 Tax=Epithele typhae TaxID=378194 RepID=UPI002008B459|nr:cyclin-like protein [Epithele typhae]KAH9936899.1 cyclin-like protein [Epithele typhae]